MIYLIISISEIERKSGPGSVIIIIINRNGFGTLHMKRGTKQNKKKNEINKQKHYYDKWLQAMITDSLINANSNKPINIHLNTHTRQTNTRNTIVRIFCIQLLIVMMMRNDFFSLLMLMLMMMMIEFNSKLRTYLTRYRKQWTSWLICTHGNVSARTSAKTLSISQNSHFYNQSNPSRAAVRIVYISINIKKISI